MENRMRFTEVEDGNHDNLGRKEDNFTKLEGSSEKNA
jgi:hypothetical protein